MSVPDGTRRCVACQEWREMEQFIVVYNAKGETRYTDCCKGCWSNLSTWETIDLAYKIRQGRMIEQFLQLVARRMSDENSGEDWKWPR